MLKEQKTLLSSIKCVKTHPGWYGSVGCGLSPASKGCRLDSPLRVHVPVEGSVPGRGHVGLIDVFAVRSVSLSLSLHPSLKVNKKYIFITMK